MGAPSFYSPGAWQLCWPGQRSVPHPTTLAPSVTASRTSSPAWLLRTDGLASALPAPRRYTGHTAVARVSTIVAGVLIGVTAVVIQSSIEQLVLLRNGLLQSLFSNGALGTGQAVATWAGISVAAVVFSGALVQLFAPKAAGAGVTLVMAFLVRGNQGGSHSLPLFPACTSRLLTCAALHLQQRLGAVNRSGWACTSEQAARDFRRLASGPLFSTALCIARATAYRASTLAREGGAATAWSATSPPACAVLLLPCRTATTSEACSTYRSLLSRLWV